MPNRLDRNASSNDRIRRNWQRLATGAASTLIKFTAPLVQTANGVILAIGNGLTVVSSTLTLKLAPLSGLFLNSTGLGALVDGSTIQINSTGQLTSSTATGGTVTSVGLALPSTVFTVSGSPVTTAGTLTGAFNTQASTTVFAGPSTGSASAPIFRGLSPSDVPALAYVASSTSLLTTAPLAGGGTLSTGLTLSIPTSSSTADGYLSSTDWTTFNNKSNDNPLIAADQSIIIGTSTGSTTIAAQLLSTGSLQTVAGGLSIKLNGTTLTTVAAGIGVNIAAPGGLGVSSGLFVNGFRISAGVPGSPAIANAWFDTTAIAFVGNFEPAPGLFGTFVCNLAKWVAATTVTASTSAQTFATDTVAFNAGFLNIVRRQLHVRLHITFSAASLANAFTFNVELGSTVIATLTTATLTSGSQDNVIDILINTQTTGASGTVAVSMATIGTVSAVSFSTTTINLTLAQTLQFTASATSTNAGDLITIQAGTVHING